MYGASGASSGGGLLPGPATTRCTPSTHTRTLDRAVAVIASTTQADRFLVFMVWSSQLSGAKTIGGSAKGPLGRMHAHGRSGLPPPHLIQLSGAGTHSQATFSVDSHRNFDENSIPSVPGRCDGVPLRNAPNASISDSLGSLRPSAALLFQFTCSLQTLLAQLHLPSDFLGPFQAPPKIGS